MDLPAALASLPATYELALRRSIDGATLEEIAEAAGVEPVVVVTLLEVATEKLRAALATDRS